MPDVFSITALTAATALGYKQAMDQAQAEERQRIRTENAKKPAGCLVTPFRLAAGEKRRIDLSTRILTLFVGIQTAQTAGAGLFYIKLGADIFVDAQTGLPAAGDWDYVAAIGAKSAEFRSDSDLDTVTIYATQPVDGVLFAGAHKEDLPA